MRYQGAITVTAAAAARSGGGRMRSWPGCCSSLSLDPTSSARHFRTSFCQEFKFLSAHREKNLLTFQFSASTISSRMHSPFLHAVNSSPQRKVHFVTSAANGRVCFTAGRDGRRVQSDSGSFPRLMGSYCCYLLPKQGDGTSQI